MGLLWENLASQLDSVRSTTVVSAPMAGSVGTAAPDALELDTTLMTIDAAVAAAIEAVAQRLGTA